MGTRNISFKDLQATLNPAEPPVGDVLVFERRFHASTHLLDPAAMLPVRFDARAFVLCTYGELSYSMDNAPCRLTKGSLLCLSNFHVIHNIHIGSHCDLIAFAVAPELSTAIEKMMKYLILSSFIHRFFNKISAQTGHFRNPVNSVSFFVKSK